MDFKQWFKDEDHDLYNYPEEAMKEAWDAGFNAAIDEAVKVAWDCNNSGDAAMAIKELKNEQSK